MGLVFRKSRRSRVRAGEHGQTGGGCTSEFDQTEFTALFITRCVSKYRILSPTPVSIGEVDITFVDY